MYNQNRALDQTVMMRINQKRTALRARLLSLTCLGLILMAALGACLPPAPSGEPTPLPEKPSPTPTVVRSAPSATPGPTATPTPAPLIPVDPNKLSGVKIQFLHPWTGATADTLRTLVDEFNRANEHKISVELVDHNGGWDSLENRLVGALETGQAPDVSAGFLYQALKWDVQNIVADLAPYAADPHWGLGPDAPADFYPAVWAQTLAGGRRPAFPLLPSAAVLIYNVSWAQELGYRTPPVTVQQFADQTCTAADAYRQDGVDENDGTGGMVISPDYAAALNWIHAFEGEVADLEAGGEDEIVYTFDRPQARDAFAYLRDLYVEGCIWATDQMYTDEEFTRRAALFATGSLLDLPYWAQTMQRSGSRDGWAVIPYPTLNGPAAEGASGENLTIEDAQGVSVSGPTLMVFAPTPERRLAAWLLIRWLAQPSNHARLVEASGAFPLRRSELPLLDAYRIRSPQWSMALSLLPDARPEPAYASWGEVRWALSDAFTQLFRSYFEAKNIPTMLSYLDAMAAELHTGKLPEDLFTPEPSGTP
jgi:ABC-type glycerol-3-phosphate transport system substrate-binding protein